MSPNFYDSDDIETEGGYRTDFNERNFNNFNTYNTVDRPVEAETDFGNTQRPSLIPEKYVRRSLPHAKRYKGRERPKPLQPDNEKYYDHIFPKDSKSKVHQVYYQPRSLDHAEL